MAESAIVVRLVIPRAIERVRRAAVPGASLGVPAHVTILYPFLEPDELSAEIHAELAAMAGEVQAFEVRFGTVSRWPGVVYLEPEPRAPFTALIERVAARFPDHPPYGGAIDEVIPHLTVAEAAEGPSPLEPLDAIQAALPFRTPARALDVIAQGMDGRWRRRWRLPFRP
jgi:2'-5' RNA ligase